MNYTQAVEQIKESIIGMDSDKASNLLDESGWQLCVVKTETGSRARIQDVRDNRFNVETKNGVIVRVIGVG